MRAKTAGRLVGLTWLAVAFVFANSTSSLTLSSAGATQAAAAQAQALSNAAQNQAQAYLDRFYSLALSSSVQRRTNMRPRVQVALNGSIYWAEPLARSDHGYSAVLLIDGTSGRAGDVVEFDKADVRDWSFRGRNKIYYGEFQRRVHLSTLSREDAALRGTQLTASPVPPGW